MKAFYLFLIALFIYQCSSKACMSVTSPSKAKDCNEAEPGQGYHKCCYLNGKLKGQNEEKLCIPLKKEEYDDIKNYISNKKKEAGEGNVEKLDIDCNSKYLVHSVILLLLFLF